MKPQVLIPPSRSWAASAGAILAAAFCGALSGSLGVDEGLPPNGRFIAAGVFGLLALSFAVAGLGLLARRGGLWLDTANKRLGIGLTSARDLLWLPLDRVAEIRLRRTTTLIDGEAYTTWSASLELVDAPAIVLADSEDRTEALIVARQVAELTEIPIIERDDEGAEPPAPPVHADERHTLAVRRGAALHGILATFGVSLSVVGVGLFMALEAFPAIGLFIAPVMALLGAALLGVVIVKRLATEELVHDNQRWTHAFTLGRWRWGERTIKAAEPHFRLRLRAMKGACLEVVGDEGVLYLAHGATTRSRAAVADLMSFPRRFATPPPASGSPSPPPPA